ncbi:9633_t:CDS:2 [Paraglomus occultum]|uniref:9633_t:CDS:1 n=1 Tax=Paraglomus occultum TaxID=144539 RepID=A0A9N8ZD27_9GLOM|nr:9633_t:CDS:2 [Paraglomus occultum]
MPSWLEKMKKQYYMLVSETDQTARPLYWRIVDASDRSVVPDILHEEDFLELNAMFSSALNLGNQESNWTVLDPPAERCLQSLSNLNSNQLCEVAKIVKPEGTRGAILRLQKISDNIKEEAFEPGLFGDDNVDDNTPCPCPVQETDYMNPDVQYILDLLRFTFEMLEKGIPQRKNSERDIDVFIKTHIFSCFDGVLDRHFGDMVSRASRRRRVEAVDAPNKAEGFHVDWLFTKHDLAKDVPWGHEFSLCERAGSKVENDKKVDLHTLRVQKTLRDMHSALFEAIATAGGGALSRSVLHACTKLLMPGFISSWFFIRVMLVIYVGAGFYSSTKLADSQYGFRMIIMEYVEGRPLSSLQPPEIMNMSRKDRNNIYNDVLQAITVLHKTNTVFGDLRTPNILLVETSSGVPSESTISAILVDFEWCGIDQKGRYPLSMSRTVPWPSGAEPGALLRTDHDNYWLGYLKRQLNVQPR